MVTTWMLENYVKCAFYKANNEYFKTSILNLLFRSNFLHLTYNIYISYDNAIKGRLKSKKDCNVKEKRILCDQI